MYPSYAAVELEGVRLGCRRVVTKGKRAEGRVFVSFEVIGSIPISGTTITIVELDVKRSNPTPGWRREKRARLIT